MKHLYISFLVVFFVFFIQIVGGQAFISKPSLGFTQACASPLFNTFDITFSFTPETNSNPTNQFIIELSDSSGSFANPNILFTSTAGSVVESPATLNFSLPTSTSGEAYKIRVKSTGSGVTSQNSSTFAAYYKVHDSPFTINNSNENGSYCSGGSYLLTIDNPSDGMSDSPLQYPSLTFEWRKKTSPTTSVFVANGSSYSVSEPGTYFVKTDYGTCTSDSSSNHVTISEAGSGNTTSSINSSLGNPFCSTEGATTLSAISGDSYIWLKDGKEISGATSQTYVTEESGEFSVIINLGSCTASASILLESNGFTSSIDVADTETINEGGAVIASITTDATAPEFEWFFNEVVISGATTNSYEATQVGRYKAIVKQTIGCISTNEFEFIVKEPFPDVADIPNLISPNGDGINDTWVIPQNYVNGANTEVLIINAQGKTVFKTNNYQNNWPENQLDFQHINPVYYYIITTPDNKTKKGSITVVK
ncbi:gliding motility-associated C-terminal domain-containing protein [Mariniflexile ostreae]|uniref:Gliding motility-associated C-terminal domain-containing protein n=1 Tax=Mariniflexile ostreae TaxID=1520892 RepID=A0ABV5F874_9FLAO